MNSDYQKWLCDACGYIYDEAKGDPDSGLAPGTRYADIPEDWECPLCGLTKGDLRPLPEAIIPAAGTATRSAASRSSKSKGGKNYIVIVGAGIAGWSAAEAIRRRDPSCPILLVSACKGLIYPKPAISMAMRQGKQADQLIDNDAQALAANLGIEVRTETRAIKIDTKRKRLTTVKGGIEYNKLVLALGAHQRELPVTGNAADEILRVNDLSSYRKLRSRLDSGAQRITILGAGLIGCEFADDISSAGYDITIVDPQQQPLSGILPEEMGKNLQQKLVDKGVKWHFGVTLHSLNKWNGHLNATLSDNSQIDTDLVLSAAGLIANIKLAEKSGLATDAGITVDNDMRTSNPDIYAIGDCASLDGKVFAFIEPIRRQAEAIAADVVGDHERFMPLPPLIKVKTPSMPLSICCSESGSSVEWTQVEHGADGCHYEVRNGTRLMGFALSGKMASGAGGIYSKLVL